LGNFYPNLFVLAITLMNFKVPTKTADVYGILQKLFFIL